MINYKDKYRGTKGACASCRYIRSKEPGVQGEYIPYDGGKFGYCINKSPIADIIIRDEPNMDAPINACWEPAG